MNVYVDSCATSIGEATIVASSSGVLALVFGERSVSGSNMSNVFEKLQPESILSSNKITTLALKQLSKYFAGNNNQFRVRSGVIYTAFESTVIAAIRKIPFGETMTYGEIASVATSPHAARAVGRICTSNMLAPIIPTHRVVSSNGLKGNVHLGGVRYRLLKHEGIKC